MMTLLAQRLMITSVLFAVFFIVCLRYRRWRKNKTQDIVWKKYFSKDLTIQKPALLYFWLDTCAQCKPQEYHIEKAQKILDENGKSLHVLKFNAAVDLNLAKVLQVITVPTTIIIDARGKVVAWNPGLTSARKLVEQVRTIY